jgi:hypothetical protein
MRGHVYREGTRRTGALVGAVAAGTVLALAIGPASSAVARPSDALQQHARGARIGHTPSVGVVKLPPAVAHAAGHKIA